MVMAMIPFGRRSPGRRCGLRRHLRYAAPGPQVAGQPAQLGPVHPLVDRLVHDMPGRVAWDLAAGRLADLLRAPPLLQPLLHGLAHHQVGGDLVRPRPGAPLHGQLVRGERRYWPLSGSQLRRSSRLIVDGLRPVFSAIARTPAPALRKSAIRTRSSSDRYRSEISRRATFPV